MGARVVVATRASCRFFFPFSSFFRLRIGVQSCPLTYPPRRERRVKDRRQGEKIIQAGETTGSLDATGIFFLILFHFTNINLQDRLR
jgi:hypothetical protein